MEEGLGAFCFRFATESAPPSGGGFECGEANRQTIGVRMLRFESRLSDACAVEPLETLAQHRSVVFLAEASCDVDAASRVNAQEVTVVGEMVDGAQRQPVHNRGYALGGRVGHYVRRLHEFSFA